MRDENCIFCKLANGDIPTNAIYEDDDFKVILDAAPVSRGHALILPKQHYANIYELGEKEAERLFPLAKKLAGHIAKITGCDGMNILQNNGEAAGQTVFHFHTHLIPRYTNATNNQGLLAFTHPDISEEEIKKTCEELSFPS